MNADRLREWLRSHRQRFLMYGDSDVWHGLLALLDEAEAARPLLEAAEGLNYLAPINISKVGGIPKIVPASFDQYQFIGDGAEKVLKAALSYRDAQAAKGDRP